MRNITERQEAVDAGTVRLVGSDKAKIFDGVSKLIMDEVDYQSMSIANNPYGDGRASEKIVQELKRFLVNT